MTKIAQVFLRLEMVVAVADNGVIGRELGLPWRQRADLAHFKALTLGHPILMGRKTWQGLGRALPGRLNLVLSRTPDDAMPGATGVSSLAQARDIALREQAQVESPVLMIIGGATVYAEAMPQVQVIHLTELHGSPTGDVFFPPWDRSLWTETTRVSHPADEQNDFPYSFVTLTRRASE